MLCLYNYMSLPSTQVELRERPCHELVPVQSPVQTPEEILVPKVSCGRVSVYFSDIRTAKGLDGPRFTGVEV